MEKKVFWVRSKLLGANASISDALDRSAPMNSGHEYCGRVWRRGEVADLRGAKEGEDCRAAARGADELRPRVLRAWDFWGAFPQVTLP